MVKMRRAWGILIEGAANKGLGRLSASALPAMRRKISRKVWEMQVQVRRLRADSMQGARATAASSCCSFAAGSPAESAQCACKQELAEEWR